MIRSQLFNGEKSIKIRFSQTLIVNNFNILHSKHIIMFASLHYIRLILLQTPVFQIFKVQHEDEEHHKSPSDLLGSLRHRGLPHSPHPFLPQRGSLQGEVPADKSAGLRSQFSGSDSHPVQCGPQHGLCSHAHLHSDIWKGIYQQFDTRKYFK